MKILVNGLTISEQIQEHELKRELGKKIGRASCRERV